MTLCDPLSNLTSFTPCDLFVTMRSLFQGCYRRKLACKLACAEFDAYTTLWGGAIKEVEGTVSAAQTHNSRFLLVSPGICFEKT